MKAKKNEYDEYVVEGGDYNETISAQPTSRLLEGRDYGYDQEYKGYGEVDGIPCAAVYLLSEEDYNNDDDGEANEDAGSWDWKTALDNGRIVVDVDELTDEEMEALADGQDIRRPNAMQVAP